MIADPKLVQEITTNKSYDYIKPVNSAGISLVGRGLIYSEGDDHKRQRKMATPAFVHSNIKVTITILHYGNF